MNASWSPPQKRGEFTEDLKPDSGGKSPKILLFKKDRMKKTRCLKQLNKGMLITEEGTDGSEIQKIVFNTVQTLENTDKNYTGTRSNSLEDWRNHQPNRYEDYSG